MMHEVDDAEKIWQFCQAIYFYHQKIRLPITHWTRKVNLSRKCTQCSCFKKKNDAEVNSVRNLLSGCEN